MQSLFSCRYLTCTFLLIVSSVFSSQVLAVEVKGLYSAEVAVADQSSTVRQEGFAQALKQVLVKVSGDPNRLETSGVFSAASQASGYVQTYSYQKNPEYEAYLQEQERLTLLEAQEQVAVEKATISESLDSRVSNDVELEAAVEVPGEYLLKVAFAKASIDALMAQYQIPVWGDVRPSILLWAVRNTETGRQLVGSGDLEAAPYYESLEKEAKKHGLPVFLPVVDLEDLGRVDLDGLWGLYSESVAQASQRYAPDIITIMRMRGSLESGFDADWQVDMPGGARIGSLEAESLEALWSQWLNEISVLLAERYAVLQRPEQESRELSIRVSQVVNFDDYAALQSYLNALPPVSGVYLEWVQGSEVAYTLSLKSDQQQLLDYLSLGGVLKQVQSQFFESLGGELQSPAFDEGAQEVSSPDFIAAPERLEFHWMGARNLTGERP